MAEKTLKTRIALLYKSYSDWDAIKATYIPLKGEVCFCEVPTGTGAATTEPAILFKVGDGVKTFEQLPWTSALAADVYAWAKKESLEFTDLDSEFKAKLEEFISQHAPQVDTQYQIVANGKDKWKLQKSTDGQTWVDATGTIDVSGKVDGKLEGTLGTSFIFNEKDGGGSKFEAKTGEVAYVGTHDNIGGEVGTQIYVDNENGTESTIIDVTKNGAYYTKGALKPGSERDVEANEIATKGDIAAIEIPEYNLTKEADAGDYAAIYHLTKDGVNIGAAINIPKDQLLKSVEVKTCTKKDEPITGLVVGDKYLDFTFIVEAGAEVHTYIAIKDMVKPYTAGNGIIITSENAIEVDTDVIATVEYVDQEVAAEEARAIASEEALDERIEALEMPTVPEYNATLKVLFTNGNSVRITDNGTANVAEWFGEGSSVGNPNTLEFPYATSVSCGGNGKDKALTFEGCQLVMDGGDVKTIRGGGLGACTVGDVDITVNGGKITAVTGGGQKYYSNIKAQNTVENVHITINGGNWYGQKIICAGGTDAVNVGHAVVDMNAGDVAYCYASGGNGGIINDSTLNLKGGKIGTLLGAVRGYISDVTMNLLGTEVTNMWAGACEDETDDGEVKNVTINALGGSVDTLQKGYSKRTSNFNCTGEYNAQVIGNETQAAVECNLTEKVLILNCNL